jgi:hypothetical protein
VAVLTTVTSHNRSAQQVVMASGVRLVSPSSRLGLGLANPNPNPNPNLVSPSPRKMPLSTSHSVAAGAPSAHTRR